MRGLRSRRSRGLVNSYGGAIAKCNTVTRKDQKMINEGWHRFWAKRGMEAPTDSDFCFSEKPRKKELVDVDLR